jgi:hypothetical protein
MESKNALRSLAIAVVLQLGMLAGSAQTNIYLYTGYKTNITLAAVMGSVAHIRRFWSGDAVLPTESANVRN